MEDILYLAPHFVCTSFERFIQKNRSATDNLDKLTSTDLNKQIAEISSSNEPVGSGCDRQTDNEEEVNFVIKECAFESLTETNCFHKEEATENKELLPAGNDSLLPPSIDVNNTVDAEDLPLINFVPHFTEK
ncbi:hypothetical protein QE152_g32409 [Popillia japonica]|uniref:Uncharacterized protein n=1 Tax=Popillia japonica TaxID=7064 RepID=A0AAW1IYW4_POPJA